MRATVKEWVRPAETDVKKKEVMSPDANNTNTPAVIRPADTAVSGGPLKRSAPPAGVDGLSALPVAFPDVELGSEVFLGRTFISHLMDACGGQIVETEGALWAYGPTCWRKLPPESVKRAVQKFDGVLAGPKYQPIMMKLSQVKAVIELAGSNVADAEFFNEPAIGINVKNGFVTIDSNGVIDMREHSPDDRLRFAVDTEFHLHTDMSPPEGTMLYKLLNDAFLGDPDADDKRNLIGEILGAVLLGIATRVKQPKAFIFLGETANNSKSTVARLISMLVPDGAVSSISPASFEDEKHIVSLAGKAANVADELSAGAIAGEQFKKAVTGDAISARDVYSKAITFRPRALHCYTTNVLPRFNGGIDRGLRRRLVVVQFNRSIPENDVIEDISDRIRDKELDLLLGFAIAGAQRLRKQGGYTIPSSSKNALQEWLLLDPLNEWFEIKMMKADDGGPGIRTAKAYEDFKAWSLEQGYDARFLPPVNTFSQRLKSMPDVVLKRKAEGTVLMGVKMKSGAGGDLYDVF